LGGPCAPALKIALALGDGGGKTTPEEWLASVLALAGVSPAVPPDSRGEDSAVALPPSDCSLGIWTFNLGLFAPTCALLVREGGGNSPGIADGWFLWDIEGTLCGLGGGGVGADACFRSMVPTSTD